jgi:hypothetical protein
VGLLRDIFAWLLFNDILLIILMIAVGIGAFFVGQEVALHMAGKVVQTLVIAVDALETATFAKQCGLPGGRAETTAPADPGMCSSLRHTGSRLLAG